MTIANLLKKLSMTTAGAAFIALGTVGTAQAVTINFDVDANGNPINAPAFFGSTNPLTDLYASLGVKFRGPSPNLGGAILNQAGSFGVNARSGQNFLAFNDNTYAQDPETILFDTLQGTVSIYASGGFDANTFRLDAFNSSNTLIGSSSVSSLSGSYGLLSFSSNNNDISYVVLTSLNDSAYVYDDLSFNTIPTSVPEPSNILGTLVFGAFGVSAFMKRQVGKRKVIG